MVGHWTAAEVRLEVDAARESISEVDGRSRLVEDSRSAHGRTFVAG